MCVSSGYGRMKLTEIANPMTVIHCVGGRMNVDAMMAPPWMAMVIAMKINGCLPSSNA